MCFVIKAVFREPRSREYFPPRLTEKPQRRDASVPLSGPDVTAGRFLSHVGGILKLHELNHTRVEVGALGGPWADSDPPRSRLVVKTA